MSEYYPGDENLEDSASDAQAESTSSAAGESNHIDRSEPQRGEHVRVHNDGESEDDWEYRTTNKSTGNIVVAKYDSVQDKTIFREVSPGDFAIWQHEKELNRENEGEIAEEVGEVAVEETVEAYSAEIEAEKDEPEEKKIKRAHAAHLNNETIEKGKELGYPLDLLIAATEDPALHRWLVERGVPLPGEIYREEGEVESQETRAETRKKDRLAAKVSDLYPPGDPNVITGSETQYFVEKIEKDPGWLRNSLIRPGSLSLPKELYRNPVLRPILDVLNFFYHPIGQRLLARRLFKDRRARHPHDDYGPTHYGGEKRLQMLEHVQKVDKTVARARRLLSPLYRHSLRGDLRKNPRLDLAQEISEARRDIQAFETGRAKLPDEREQYDVLKDVPERTPAQEERLKALEKIYPLWTSAEYEHLKNIPDRNLEQEERFQYLSGMNPQ